MAEKLTERECEVLRLIAAGLSTKQVAFQLGISFKTASTHRSNIISKLGAANTADLVVRAVQGGWLQVTRKPGAAPSKELLFFDEERNRLLEQMRYRRISLRAVLEDAKALCLEIAQSRQEITEARTDLRRTLESIRQTVESHRPNGPFNN